MAEIELDCPQCGSTLLLDAAFAGGVARCSECGTMMTVPALDSGVTASRPSRPAGPGGAGRPSTPPGGMVPPPVTPPPVAPPTVEPAGPVQPAAAQPANDVEALAAALESSGNHLPPQEAEVDPLEALANGTEASAGDVMVGQAYVESAPVDHATDDDLPGLVDDEPESLQDAFPEEHLEPPVAEPLPEETLDSAESALDALAAEPAYEEDADTFELPEEEPLTEAEIAAAQMVEPEPDPTPFLNDTTDEPASSLDDFAAAAAMMDGGPAPASAEPEVPQYETPQYAEPVAAEPAAPMSATGTTRMQAEALPDFHDPNVAAEGETPPAPAPVEEQIITATVAPSSKKAKHRTMLVGFIAMMLIVVGAAIFAIVVLVGGTPDSLKGKVTGDTTSPFVSEQSNFLSVPMESKAVIIVDGFSKFERKNEAIVAATETFGTSVSVQVLVFTDAGVKQFPDRMRWLRYDDRMQLKTFLGDVMSPFVADAKEAFEMAAKLKPQQIVLMTGQVPLPDEVNAIEKHLATLPDVRVDVVHLGSDVEELQNLAKRFNGDYVKVTKAKLTEWFAAVEAAGSGASTPPEKGGKGSDTDAPNKIDKSKNDGTPDKSSDGDAKQPDETGGKKSGA